MDWTRHLVYLEASIALLLIVRVHLLGLRSVRATLLFLLLPDILAPLTFFFDRVGVDYRILWIGFGVLDWVCLVGLVYALLAAVFSQLPELLRYFRTLWTVAFAAAMLTALSQRESYLWTQVLDSLVAHAFVLDRAVLTVVGLVLIVVLGFIFWYPVKLSQNLTILSIGVVIKVALQTMMVMLLAVRGGARLAWVYPTMDLVSTVCLAYWLLFLSRHGETEPA